MIKMNSYEDFNSLCFSDFNVLNIEIDLINKKIKINLEGIWLIKNPHEERELGQGYVQITNYNNFTSNFSNSTSGLEGKSTIEQIKELKEIDYHEVGNNSIEFGGFINDGSWLKCKIDGGEVMIDFSEK